MAITVYAGDIDIQTSGVNQNSGAHPIWENVQNITSNYTITNGYNALSAGPITINNGITVTIGSGETWTIV